MNTGSLFTLVPAITAVLAVFINRERIGHRRAIGLFLGTMGALWILFRGDWKALTAMDLNHGDLVFLAGCLCLGLYNTLIKRLYRNEPMEVMTFWVLFWGMIWLFALSFHEIRLIDWLNVDRRAYAGIAYLSFFTTLITFFLAQFSIVRIGPTKVAAYNFLTPVFVILLSIISGMESFLPITLPGIFLVIGAMVLIQWEKEADRT